MAITSLRRYATWATPSLASTVSLGLVLILAKIYLFKKHCDIENACYVGWFIVYKSFPGNRRLRNQAKLPLLGRHHLFCQRSTIRCFPCAKRPSSISSGSPTSIRAVAHSLRFSVAAGILPAVSGGILAARSAKLNPRHDLVSSSENTRLEAGDTAARMAAATNPSLLRKQNRRAVGGPPAMNSMREKRLLRFFLSLPHFVGGVEGVL